MTIQLQKGQPLREVVTHSGVLSVVVAGFTWGLYPLFWKTFADIPPYEIMAIRAICSLVFLALWVISHNGWNQIAAILKSGRNLLGLSASAFLYGTHIILFVIAIQNGSVMQCSMGMFLSYVISMVLGLIVFKEHYQLLNWLTLILGVAATVLLTSNAQDFPWFALGIGLTWALYGLARKKASVTAEPIVQTLVEMAILAVPSAIYLLFFTNLATVNLPELNRLWLIIGCGATAIPSVLYGEGAKRLPLSALGLFHSLSPSIQFLLAIFVYHETASPVKMQAFGLLWLALALYSYQQWKRSYS